MKEAYPTFIIKDGNDYLAYVPDLDIYTEGNNFVNAIEMARDAIFITGISMKENNEKIPVPSEPKEAVNKAKADTEIIDFTKGVLTYVDVDFNVSENKPKVFVYSGRKTGGSAKRRLRHNAYHRAENAATKLSKRQ